MPDDRRLGRQRIQKLLQEVNDELKRKKIKVVLRIRGGAAMALEYNHHRTTTDVDTMIESESHGEVEKAVWKVGRRHGLADSWLNEEGSHFFPKAPDPQEKSIYVGENVRAFVAGEDYMIAMKIRAGRKIDVDDLAVLGRRTGHETVEALLKIQTAVFNEESSERHRRTAEEAENLIRTRKAEDRTRTDGGASGT